VIDWSVDYWDAVGSKVATRTRDAHGPWEALPTQGVVRVHLRHGEYRHTMQGMDNYWLCETCRTYGMFNDPENAAWYEGQQALAWAWPTPDAHAPIANPRPPKRAHILRGVMLPDPIARELGLLGPHDASPPRSS
jgi:hypothetical protein